MAVVVRIPETIAKLGSAAAAGWTKTNEEFLKNVFEQHTSWITTAEVEKYQAAYDGTLESVDTREKSRGDDVNHKLQVNYAQVVIDTVIDYMLGKPIVWTVKPNKDEQVDENLANEYRRMVMKVLREEESQRVLAEQLRQGSIAGMDSIICWVDERGQIMYDEFPVQEVIPVLDVRGQLRLVLRKYEVTEGEDVYTMLEVYDDRYVTVYQGDEKGESFTLLTYADGSPNPAEHKAARIPVSLYTNGRPSSYLERSKKAGASDLANGVFSLIDDYSNTLSDKANTADRMQDQLLKLTGVTLGGTKAAAEAEVLSMRKARAIALKSKDSNAEYLAPEQADGAVENYLDRLQAAIHDTTFIPKLNGISGATAMEIRMKYSSLDIKAGKKEVYFTSAIRNFVAIITDMLNVKRLTLAGDPDPYLTITENSKELAPGDPAPAAPKVPLFKAEWLEFTINRNLPQNFSEISGIVSQLAGIVPDIYLYELLWFIDDPKAALDEMKQQKEAAAAEAAKALGFGGEFGDLTKKKEGDETDEDEDESKV